MLRNITIKAAVLYPHHLEKYDEKPNPRRAMDQPLLNDLDQFSRYYETPVMNEKHYISARGPLAMKVKHVGSRLVDGADGQRLSAA
jgi:hypothetical protein